MINACGENKGRRKKGSLDGEEKVALLNGVVRKSVTEKGTCE